MTTLVAGWLWLLRPQTDPLTALLAKYIEQPDKRPVRDVYGDWRHTDFHTLVMTNSWRALARMARDRCITTDPEEVHLILSLWHLRLSALSRLRLYNQTATETASLFGVLNALEPPAHRAYLFERLLPFELEVMHARTAYWAGDHMGYLDALVELQTRCKRKSREAGREARALERELEGSGGVGKGGGGKKERRLEKRREASLALVSMWKERGARVSLIMASQLIEMKDHVAATRILESLLPSPAPTPDSHGLQNLGSPALRSAIARIYLQCGTVQRATYHFQLVAQDPEADDDMLDMNDAFLSVAHGDWQKATEALKRIMKKDPENYVAVNNLSVTLLSQGKLQEAIEVLEAALATSPSSVVSAEPFLFNLATLYELRSTQSMDRKKALLIEVAKWSGDGLRATCLKMPIS